MIGKAGTSKTQIVLWQREARMHPQFRKPLEEEIVLDLAQFLPGGRKFWWADEVDEMVRAIREHMPEHIDYIVNETTSRAHVRHQVLHVALSNNLPEEEFHSQVRQVIGLYKAAARHARERRHRAAS